MSPFAEFLDVLLREGRAVLRGPPHLQAEDKDAANLLGGIYADYRLRVAGPAINFDPGAAQAAATLVYRACWFLLSRDEPESELDRLLKLPAPACSPAAHLSADLVLRFLPQVHHRAKAHNPADRLTALLADVLRRWPLSGVLADVDEGPLTAITFDDHPGLFMLYVERLAQHEKPAWIPHGPDVAYLELVYSELGKDPAELLAAAQPSAMRKTGGQEERTHE
jgi:hypothetical protein